MAKKQQENQETQLTYDQILLKDIKHNEDEIAKKSREIEQHFGALNYAKYAYEQYMKLNQKLDEHTTGNEDAV